MAQVTDDLGRIVRIHTPSPRIISLVPSTTETIFDLGLGRLVVGCTRFCVRPVEALGVPRVGGTKDVDFDRVRGLAPDLVVANQEENLPEIDERLRTVAPVYVASPGTVQGATEDLLRLSELLGAAEAGRAWAARIARAREALACWRDRPLRALVLIWRAPWMGCGSDTFVSSMLREAGLVNTVEQGRYPTLTAPMIRSLAPDVVLLLSEPFPFRARHAQELAEATTIPRDRFVGFDGEYLTWHGTRMARALPALLEARRRGFPEVPVR